MNVLIDTNVILDIILRREPFYNDAARISVLSEKGCIRGFISASAVTDVFYIAKKQLRDTEIVLDLIKNVFKNFYIRGILMPATKGVDFR